MRRRQVRAALTRLLEAETVEELLCGSPREHARTSEVLMEVARGTRGTLARLVEAFAARRGITPAYLADRAMVFLATLAELRRQDLYLVLGVRPGASPAEVRSRWRAIARRLHPDATGSARPSAAFLELKVAYDTLADPTRRARYDVFWLTRVAPLLPVLRAPLGALPVRRRCPGGWWPPGLRALARYRTLATPLAAAAAAGVAVMTGARHGHLLARSGAWLRGERGRRGAGAARGPRARCCSAAQKSPLDGSRNAPLGEAQKGFPGEPSA